MTSALGPLACTEVLSALVRGDGEGIYDSDDTA
jgi:hypothetical protein